MRRGGVGLTGSAAPRPNLARSIAAPAFQARVHRNLFVLAFTLLCFLSSVSSASVVKGIILDNPTGRPLARAQVSLQQLATTGGQHQTFSALSDSYGRFDFQVPEGVYVLHSTKRNYVAAHFGQHGWNLPGVPITVGPDALFVAEVRMKRLGVITGEVWDENHLGIPNVRVFAYRAAKNLKPAAWAESDDRGVYRIFGLTPGKYYVRTAPKELEGNRGLLPTFYGLTVRREGAMTATVRIEEEVSGLNIEPFPGRLSTLTIVAQAPETATIDVSLHTEFGVKTARASVTAPAVFSELAPGSYDVAAEGRLPQRPPDDRISGFTRVLVDHPMETAPITLGKRIYLHASCRTDRGSELSQPVSPVAVRVIPDDGLKVPLSCSGVSYASYGVFDIQTNVPEGMYFDSVAAPTEVKDNPHRLDLTGRYTWLVNLRFASPGSIRGVVKAAGQVPYAGAPVIAKPLDDSVQAKLRRAAYTTSGEDGKFELKGLPPGQYEVISSLELGEPEDGEWDYPSGKSVLVEAGKTEDVDISLTVIPGVQ